MAVLIMDGSSLVEEEKQLAQRQEELIRALDALTLRIQEAVLANPALVREKVLAWRQETIARRIGKLEQILQERMRAGKDGRGFCAQRSDSAVTVTDKESEAEKLGSKVGEAAERGTAVSKIVKENSCSSGISKIPSVNGLTLLGYGPMEKRLGSLLSSAGSRSFVFRRVPGDYYERPMVERMRLLSAASINHLCKSIVMVNSQAGEDIIDCSNKHNSKYYVVVIQYSARLNAEKVRSFVHSLNEGRLPKKRFNLRLAPEAESDALTGFQHNAVTPFGMRTDIPVILSDAITKLTPTFFWLGGGEVDLKLGMEVSEFVRIVQPFVCDCIY